MYLVNKLFSHAFDEIYLQLMNKKTCHYKKQPDMIDDKVFSIDEFYESYKKYFDKPWEFYRDFKENGDLNFREGVHFYQKYNYKSTYNFKSCLFDSPIKTEWPENDLVPFKWFTDDKKRSKTLILFSPGGWRPNYKVEEFFCNHLFSNGIDAGLLTCPYHIERTPNTSEYSGEYFISANVFWTIFNFRHYVAEIRRVIQHMRNHYEYIGIVGMSSGGFYAGIASDCEQLDFLFPFISGCKLGSITFNGKITKYVRKDLESVGIDEDALNKAWSISDQLILGKHTKAKYIKSYISLFDIIVPTEYQYLLWEAYGKPDKLELEIGHNSSFFMLKKVANDIINIVKERTTE